MNNPLKFLIPLVIPPLLVMGLFHFGYVEPARADLFGNEGGLFTQSPISGAAGSNSYVQYNAAGVLGAEPAFTYNSGTDILNVASIQQTNKTFYGATNTPSGTTGNQTINKPSGKVNFASSAVSLAVTNSMVTTSSIVFVNVLSIDDTMNFAKAVVANGSFTIYPDQPPTEETTVGFLVIN